ncbi:hypothetical protein EJ04DRAFT_569335 [Polyplosphaeria fusca]|uniref:Uncharacterized protein n=1 Tax=Polyplosphaeria fusca TaxID=682080 RepID=A0A9P4UU93_9PLEO|nr:hypothetical protein EJ04DRAFT_569335 [Polyplosphaeria fusca]
MPFTFYSQYPSIGRLQASLAAATNEVTVAAANINFDFTLIKAEAPKEYQILGGHLSQRRKEKAEFGTLHVTARRFGALFQGVCPHTPKLVQAYGTRVSEIAEAAKKLNPPENPKAMFAGHSGIDGTSIWAAATSSVTALHIQLLACMLARLCNGSEAISVWVELIEGRRKEIASNFESGQSLPFSTYTAAVRGEIARSDIADWDASARAWLRTADAVKRKKQKQLMLILENIDVPVTEDKNVLSAVVVDWTSALNSMELLISGTHRAVRGGPTILGLSAWHIYPNMIILERNNPEVCMNDPLVAPSGTFTIGIRPAADHRGAHWSLSLAHLRYYGHPISTHRNIQI